MAWSYNLDDLAMVLGVEAPLDGNVSFSGVCTDTRKILPGQLFVALQGDNFDGNKFAAQAIEAGAAAALVSSANRSGPYLVTDNTLKALQDFAAYHRARFAIPLFALTGSCGKTSAKDFTTALLATKYNVIKTLGNLNNEIGCPLSLLAIQDDTTFAVIEMGANHVGEIEQLCKLARPTESAVTMVAPAHLEGFGSVLRVAAAKSEIMNGLPEGGPFYVNADDPWCMLMAQEYTGEKIYFGAEGDVVLRSCKFDEDGEMLLDIAPIGKLKLPLPIRAQTTNILLAIAVGLQHGIDEIERPLREACKKTTRFKVEQIGPLEVIDDSYNANPASMIAALETLPDRPAKGKRIAALGDMLELGRDAASHHEKVGEAVARCGVSHLFARGEYACAMISGAQAAGTPHAEVLDTHASIADAIAAIAEPGDVLLVKGSRGLQMEKVIQELRSKLDPNTEQG